jgi:hypothetical protein
MFSERTDCEEHERTLSVVIPDTVTMIRASLNLLLIVGYSDEMVNNRERKGRFAPAPGPVGGVNREASCSGSREAIRSSLHTPSQHMAPSQAGRSATKFSEK